MFNRCFLFTLTIFAFSTLQAQKAISLEEIWKKNTFSARSVPGFSFQNDGRHYTRLDANKIVQYDLTTGSSTASLFDPATLNPNLGIDAYQFSADESKLILATAVEPIYRHSSRASFYVYDRNLKQLSPLFAEGKTMYATFSPKADKVAFVFKNNLYYKELASGKTTQITTDGALNSIINGATDWVYEEEFAMDCGFAWSPDGSSIAFYRFDEQEVPQYTLSNFEAGMYPSYVTYKYPKVGEKNSKVSIHLYNLASGKTIKAETDPTTEYIPRIKWTNDPSKLCIFTLNRHQDQLDVLLADAGTGKTSILLQEDNKYYVDIHDNLSFLKDGKHFIWTSEMDGWNHLYLYDLNGNMVRQITSGKWEVSNFYGVDEKTGTLYFQSSEASPLERQVAQIGLDGKNKKTIFAEKGWANAQFGPTFEYYVIDHSTANSPASYTVFDQKGTKVRVIEENVFVRNLQKEYGVQPVDFFAFKTRGGTDLNGWMIKPANFDPTKKHPVLMFLYGGPGSQEVKDSWRGQNYWWFQLLAQKGYIVACVDNRGTGGRGEEFKKMTQLQLGKYETEDQIEAAKYLGRLRYVDPARIGIFGWSYGGYMSSSCLFKGAGTFKCAIAVAPVTNWKWYDNIYTERYMHTVQENPKGYQENSPINFVDQLNGNYLLVHGMGDDNVHFQHTAELVNALVDADKQFDTYFYPNRNHGIYGGNTRFHLYSKMTQFLDEKLKGPEPTQAGAYSKDILNRDAIKYRQQLSKPKPQQLPQVKE
jgi:dipeptidyl-peptidase-4